MLVDSIKTRRFKPPMDSLEDLLSYFNGKLEEGDIVAISSKVLGICEGACILQSHVDKQILIGAESDNILSRKDTGDILLTKKHDMLLEYGGVDVLKAGYYVTLPKKPYKSALTIWRLLRKQNKLRKLGVIITDSHSVPYRKGAIGMAVAGYGFRPVSINGKITSKHSSLSMIDTIDELAVAANIVMGEGAESTPIAIVRGAPGIKYFSHILPPSVMRSYMYVRRNEVYNLT